MFGSIITSFTSMYTLTSIFFEVWIVAQIQNTVSITCWDCGYAKDLNGNQIPIPELFQDGNISFCNNFVDENEKSDVTKNYPEVNNDIVLYW